MISIFFGVLLGVFGTIACLALSARTIMQATLRMLP